MQNGILNLGFRKNFIVTPWSRLSHFLTNGKKANSYMAFRANLFRKTKYWLGVSKIMLFCIQQNGKLIFGL